jgi:RecB family exonuclease
MRRDFSPCDFFAADVWFRGVPDYLALNHETGVARVGDWKTGKSSRYADPDQLELMAAMVMQHYPSIKKVKGALVFLVANDVVTASYTREQLPEILSKWGGKASMIETVMEKGVVNARPSGLCKFCPVQTCPHNS